MEFTIAVTRASLESASADQLAELADEWSRTVAEAAAAFADQLPDDVRFEVDGETLTREQVRERVFSAPERARAQRAVRHRDGCVVSAR